SAASIEIEIGVNRVAHFQLRDLHSGFFNDAGNVAAWRKWRPRSEIFGIMSGAKSIIDGIDSGSDHTNQHLVFFWRRLRRLFVSKNFGSTEFVNYNRFHRRWACLRMKNSERATDHRYNKS